MTSAAPLPSLLSPLPAEPHQTYISQCETHPRVAQAPAIIGSASNTRVHIADHMVGKQAQRGNRPCLGHRAGRSHLLALGVLGKENTRKLHLQDPVYTPAQLTDGLLPHPHPPQPHRTSFNQGATALLNLPSRTLHLCFCARDPSLMLLYSCFMSQCRGHFFQEIFLKSIPPRMS